MNRKLLRLPPPAAAFLVIAIAVSAGATENKHAVTLHASPARVAALHHDPQFVLQVVARRLGIELSAKVPLPAILLESQTPLARLQAAPEP